MFAEFYRSKRILVTGHTGFKGSWLSLWLKQLGALVFGVGLEAPTTPSFYELIRAEAFDGEAECDIRDFSAIRSFLQRYQPELIFHLAAQPLVRQSFLRPLETLSVNALGTAHVLEAARQLKLGSPVVCVTSDKCYQNQNWRFGYRENDPIGGDDIYSMSKGAAELIIHAWRASFFSRDPSLGQVASARGGNVIGGGDYAQDRIVPDCVRSLLKGGAIAVRNPGATRPWQHILDCLSGYLWLGASLARSEQDSPLASAFNFGPGPGGNHAVSELVSEFLKHWPGKWETAQEPAGPRESVSLNLSIDKAIGLLRWQPAWDFQTSVAQTAEWYRQRHLVKNGAMAEFSRSQIAAYALDARRASRLWAQEKE